MSRGHGCRRSRPSPCWVKQLSTPLSRRRAQGSDFTRSWRTSACASRSGSGPIRPVLSISARSGLGKFRHLNAHTLWVQENMRTGVTQVRKVKGKVSPAELFTNHLPSSDKISQLVELFGYFRKRCNLTLGNWRVDLLQRKR